MTRISLSLIHLSVTSGHSASSPPLCGGQEVEDIVVFLFETFIGLLKHRKSGDSLGRRLRNNGGEPYSGVLCRARTPASKAADAIFAQGTGLLLTSLIYCSGGFGYIRKTLKGRAVSVLLHLGCIGSHWVASYALPAYKSHNRFRNTDTPIGTARRHKAQQRMAYGS